MEETHVAGELERDRLEDALEEAIVQLRDFGLSSLEIIRRAAAFLEDRERYKGRCGQRAAR
jgi:hypothetical protein